MKDTYHTRRELAVNNQTYQYFSIPALAKKFPEIQKLPFSLKILLENQLRFEDGQTTTEKDINALLQKNKSLRYFQINDCDMFDGEFKIIAA